MSEAGGELGREAWGREDGYSHHPIYRANRGKLFVHSISDDTVNRMMHLAYGEHTFEIGGKVSPSINRMTR